MRATPRATTPLERYTTTIRDFLGMVAGLAPGKPSYHRLVLEHGREYTYAPKPEDVRWGTPGECFRNAAMLAMERNDLTYVEGWALRVIPIHHAWCVTADGTVVDPTWRPDDTPITYFGIPFKLPFLLRTLRRTKVWGLFFTAHHLLRAKPSTFLAA